MMARSSFRGGYCLCSNEIIKETTLSSGARWLYCVLASYADAKSRICYPSKETLIKLSGLSKNTLNKYMKELLEYGAITIETRKQKDHPNLNGSNIYKLNDTADR